jgi:putative two-component system response regulator
VDDDIGLLQLMQEMLQRQGHEVLIAENGQKAIALAKQEQPDLILLDVMMPVMDGFEVCRQIRSMPALADVPIIMLTALDDRASRLEALRAGVDDFLSKPFDGLELLARIQTITRMNRYRRIVEQRSQLEKLHEELLISYHKTIEGWSNALDLRDKETEGHTQRVTQVSIDFAREIGVSEDQIDHVRMGAMLHDIGKLGVSDRILLKPGTLTKDEMDVMKLHPVYAYQWLSPIEFLKAALDIPYCHHEKWDGSGYPRGIRGEEIPLFARLFAVVDVWDALCSERPYHDPMPEADVLTYLQTEAGKHFDPALVQVFIAMRKNQISSSQ